jgi:hypothetical protein
MKISPVNLLEEADFQQAWTSQRPAAEVVGEKSRKTR